jgi:hypothetical protein
MSAHQNPKFRYMVIKPEVTPGTAVAPTTTERVIRFRDIKASSDFDLDDENAKYSDGTHAEEQSIVGQQKGVVQCMVRCNVGSTDITTPKWWEIAKMCGCTPTSAYATTKGIGLVRRLAKDDQTYTIYVSDVTIGSSQIHTFKQYAGCVGNMTLGVDKSGGVWAAKFNIFGKLMDIVDASEIALSAPDTVQPQAYLSHAFTINSQSQKVPTWQFDLGNVIKAVPDQSDATGISHYVILESHPRLSCNPLAVKQATTDVWANILSKPASHTIQLNTAAASKLSLKILDAQYIKADEAEAEGLRSWAFNFKALGNGAPGTLIDSALTYEDTFELLQGTRS